MENGGTKDDLRLPNDEQLLSQVSSYCIFLQTIPCFVCGRIVEVLVLMHRLRMDLVRAKTLLLLLCLRWERSRFVH